MDDIQYIFSHERLSDLQCRDGDKVAQPCPQPGDGAPASLTGDVPGGHSVRLSDEDGTELPAGRSYLSKLRLMME